MSEEEKKFRVYKHVNASAQYVFSHEEAFGQTAAFVQHTYFTDDPLKISELDAVCAHFEKEAKRGHTAYIYIDPEMREATQAQIDPMEALRRQIRNEERAKLMQELQISHVKTRDAGDYVAPQNIVPRQVPKGEAALSTSNGPVIMNPKPPIPKAEEIVK